MSDNDTPQSSEKEVIVADEKFQFSFRLAIAGLSWAVILGIGAYAWQESIILAILGAIMGFVFGYLSGRLIV